MNNTSKLYLNDDAAMITLNNLPRGTRSLSSVFGALAGAKINIDMISYVPQLKETTSVSFTISGGDFAKTLEILGKFQNKLGDAVTHVNSGNVKFTLHDEQMRDTPGVAAEVFGILAHHDIEVKLITTSEIEISFLVDEKDSDKVAEALGAEG